MAGVARIRALAIVACLLAAACSPSPPAAPTSGAPGAAAPTVGTSAAVAPASGTSATAAPSASAPARGPDAAAWERVKAAAKQEGRVVVTGPGFPGLRNGLIEGFQRTHGLTLEYLGLPGGESIARIDRESATARADDRHLHRGLHGLLDDGRARPDRRHHDHAARSGRPRSRGLARRQAQVRAGVAGHAEGLHLRAADLRVGDDRPVRQLPVGAAWHDPVLARPAQAGVQGEDRLLRSAAGGARPDDGAVPEPPVRPRLPARSLRGPGGHLLQRQSPVGRVGRPRELSYRHRARPGRRSSRSRPSGCRWSACIRPTARAWLPRALAA